MVVMKKHELNASPSWGLVLRGVAMVSLAVAGQAQAVILDDAQLQQLFASGQVLALQQASEARLSKTPDDVQGSIGLALSRVEWADPDQLEQAAQSMQQCVDKQPQLAACHYALATVLSAQASSGGALKALRLAGKIRQSLQRAFELAPQSYEVRSALLQLNLILPAIAGGDEGRARSLADEVRKSHPEQARMLGVFLALKDQKLDVAERELKALKAGGDAKLLFDQRAAFGQVVREHIKAQRWARARAATEQLMKLQPRHALGAYLMSRLVHEQGQFDAAIEWLEKARKLEGSETFPLDQRIGNAYQDKGDKANARIAYERYLQTSPRHYRNSQEVRNALASLGPVGS